MSETKNKNGNNWKWSPSIALNDVYDQVIVSLEYLMSFIFSLPFTHFSKNSCWSTWKECSPRWANERTTQRVIVLSAQKTLILLRWVEVNGRPGGTGPLRDRHAMSESDEVGWRVWREKEWGKTHKRARSIPFVWPYLHDNNYSVLQLVPRDMRLCKHKVV